MPCPTYSSTIPYPPAPRMHSSTPCPMSDKWRPTRACASPAHSDDWVTSDKAEMSSAASGITIDIAASPCQPSMIAPQSIETMSADLITLSPGIPWTTSSLTDAQITAGNPWYPRKDDVAPWSAMLSRARASKSAVVIPTAISDRIFSSVCATTSPACRMSASSSTDLISIGLLLPNISRRRQQSAVVH